MKKQATILDKINVSKHIAGHLFGANHGHAHRISIGFVIAFLGTMVAKSAHLVHIPVLEILIDLIGYLIHGIGATPLIEWYAKVKIEEEKPPDLCLECENSKQ